VTSAYASVDQPLYFLGLTNQKISMLAPRIFYLNDITVFHVLQCSSIFYSMGQKRGLFIVVEGLDKAGKSTQCSRLSLNLQEAGHEAHSMRFPGLSTSRK
jgi:hypothetical protein